MARQLLAFGLRRCHNPAMLRASFGMGAALLTALLAAACGVGPQVGAAHPAAPQGMGCDQTDEFAFVGETSLDAIGLGEQFGGGPDASRIGMVWVTAGPVNMEEPAMPQPVGPGVVVAQPSRVVCVEWPDGSGMGGTIDDNWQAPPDMAGGSIGDGLGQPTASEPPYTLLMLLGAAAVLIGVSVLAFRHDRPG